MQPKDDQNVWNFLYGVFYLVILGFLMAVLYARNGHLPSSIPVFDLVLLALATFRLIRLFVYDKIMRWLRDLFAPFEGGPGKTASDLLSCPWCFGIWAATVLLFLYFYFMPIMWFLVLILAISGVASFIQLTANMIGWSAERGKRAALREE